MSNDVDCQKFISFFFSPSYRKIVSEYEKTIAQMIGRCSYCERCSLVEVCGLHFDAGCICWCCRELWMHLRTPEKEKSGPCFTASSPRAVQVTQKAQGFPFCSRANWHIGNSFKFMDFFRRDLQWPKNPLGFSSQLFNGRYKLSSSQQQGLSTLSASIRPKPRLTPIPVGRLQVPNPPPTSYLLTQGSPFKSKLWPVLPLSN